MALIGLILVTQRAFCDKTKIALFNGGPVVLLYGGRAGMDKTSEGRSITGSIVVGG